VGVLMFTSRKFWTI